MWWADFMSSSYLRRETIRASSFFFSPPPPSLRSNLYPRPARGGLNKPAEAQCVHQLSLSLLRWSSWELLERGNEWNIIDKLSIM